MTTKAKDKKAKLAEQANQAKVAELAKLMNQNNLDKLPDEPHYCPYCGQRRLTYMGFFASWDTYRCRECSKIFVVVDDLDMEKLGNQ